MKKCANKDCKWHDLGCTENCKAILPAAMDLCRRFKPEQKHLFAYLRVPVNLAIDVNLNVLMNEVNSMECTNELHPGMEFIISHGIKITIREEILDL